MKNICIVGSGWLGLPLAKYWTRKGYTVSCTSRSEEKFEKIKSSGATPLLFDIDNEKSIKHFDPKADTIICGITSKNIEGFTEWVKRLENTSVKNVLFISSTSVYPFTGKLMTEESDTVDTPLRQIEETFQNSPLQTTILRFAGLVGDKRHPGAFFRNSKVCKHPDASVNMIHLEDCLGIIDTIIEKNLWGEIFNGCADNHPTKRAFYDYYAASLNRHPPTYEEVDPLKSKCIDNTKIKTKGSYVFKYPDVMKLPQMERQD